MNISIRPLNTPQGPRWQVSFDRHSVTFRSEAEACQFIATLKARLQAPHHFPVEERRVAG